MRVMMVISYDGSKFHGFQRQKDVRNVQGYLESTLSDILKEKIVVKGSGRTDAHVHATYQVVHFDTEKSIANLKIELNNILKDIKVKKIKYVKEDFHARHSVKNKVYLYKVDLSGKRNQNYYLRAFYKLDVKKMHEAAKLFIGTHDFRNFVAGERLNYETTITKIKIYQWQKVLYLKFFGYGFYRYMIRNLVGALLEVGKGNIKKEVIESMLENPLENKCLPTARGEGLYLIKINY